MFVADLKIMDVTSGLYTTVRRSTCIKNQLQNNHLLIHPEKIPAPHPWSSYFSLGKRGCDQKLEANIIKTGALCALSDVLVQFLQNSKWLEGKGGGRSKQSHFC